MTPPPSSRACGPTRRGLLRAGAVAALGLTGQACGPSRRPGPTRSVYTPVGATLPGDAERVEQALRAWDAAGYPPLVVRVELRDAEPGPTAANSGQPSIEFAGAAVLAVTLPIQWGPNPTGAVVCARGSEHWLVHEFLHVLHQIERRPPETHINRDAEDPRWADVDRLSAELCAAMGRPR